MTTLLLTGATGLLGGAVVDVALARAYRVRALVRPTSDVTSLVDRPGVEIVTGDLTDPASLAEAVEGVDAVIHCAGGGRVRVMDDFVSQNTTTTEMLLNALMAASKPPARFVLVSSLAAQGPSKAGQPHTGEEAPRPESHYGRAKEAAEGLALAHANRLHVTIIRPPAIYGPGDTRFLPLFNRVARGRLPLTPTEVLSLIYVDDCASALVAAIEADTPSGRVFVVSDGRDVAWRDLGAAIATSLGIDTHLRTQRIPSWAIYVAGTFNELRARLTGRPVLITRDKWRDGRHPVWTCTPTRALSEFDWKPQVTLAEGLRRTVEDYRARGWLRAPEETRP